LKALILAAGYATRLYPLTLTRPKPLLPIGDRPLVDWILERMREVTDEIHLVTNRKFAAVFEEWGESRGVAVHDDGTTSEDDRLGAIGDVRFVADAVSLEGDDLLVVAGDNLFDFSLVDYVDFWQDKGEASAVALYDVGDPKLARKYGIAEVDGTDRVVAFVEKPEEPSSTLAATAAYIYHRAHLPLVERYLDEGNSADQPGRFIGWLHTRAPVYGYRFEGEWRDIGDAEQLLEADNLMRGRVGLPQRAEYALD
jgi:glucose-1-phosphate thymidylyltransferase